MARLVRCCIAVFALTLGLFAGYTNALAAYPTKPIELYVPTSAGGGSDLFARQLAKIVSDKNLSPQPIVVINKPGGSSTIGYNYVAKQKNNPYVLSITNSSYYTVPLAGKSPVSFNDFQHIALMCQDPMFLVASAKAPYKNMAALLAYGKTAGNKIIAAGTSTLSEDALSFYALRSVTGINADYVPFNSSGEVLTQLMGNHVQIGFLGPSEAASQIESGDVYPLASTTGARLLGYPNVPTLKESNIPVELCQNRGVVAPLGIDAEAIAFLEALFKKVSETEEWKEYLRKNDMVPNFMNAKEFSEFSPRINAVYAEYRKYVK
jgi:Uncharacterized protein conserved in bacteria